MSTEQLEAQETTEVQPEVVETEEASIPIGEESKLETSTEETPEVVEQTPTQRAAESGSVFSAFKNAITRNVPDFEIPPEIETGDSEAQLEYMAKTFTDMGAESKGEESDPFISQYKEAVNSGVKRDDFLRSFMNVDSKINLDSKSLLKQTLKERSGKTEQRPDGWTDEDISEHVDKMGRVERDLQADSIRAELSKSSDQRVEALSEEAKAAAATRIVQLNDNIKSQSEKLFSQMSQMEDIGGIPHTKEAHESFKTAFLDYVTVNPETGRPPIRDLLADDKKLYQALFFLKSLEDGTSKRAIADTKGKLKRDFFEKQTRVNPRSESGASATHTEQSPEDYV